METNAMNLTALCKFMQQQGDTILGEGKFVYYRKLVLKNIFFNV